MIVYVYINSWQMDSGDCGENVKVFTHLEDALNMLKDDMVEARQNMEHLDTEETDYHEGDFSWSIWEEGEYCYNHIDLTVYQREVC